MSTSNYYETPEEVEAIMYWRDYVVLPLLGFILTVFVIIATGSIIYPLIGYVIAISIICTILGLQQRKYKKLWF